MVKMAEEFEKQKSELKDLKMIMKLEEESEVISKGISFKASKIAPKNFDIPVTIEEINVSEDDSEVVIDREYNCFECGFQGSEQSQLDKHVLLTHRLQCRNCESVFKSKPELMVHRKKEHYSIVALCMKGEECRFSDRCWWKHKTEQENLIECFFCDENFATKGEVMIHRKNQHARTVKTCHKFINKNCFNTEATCWFKHESVNDGNKESDLENENNSDFRERQKNQKNP